MPMLLLVMTLFCALANPASAVELVLSGSTTVQGRILEPLAGDIKRSLDIDLKVEGVGSGNGLKRLIAGEVKAAIISSALGGLLSNLGAANDGRFVSHVVTEDDIVPIVNATNPVDRLSWEQLRGLYSGAIKNWREVGGQDLKVQVVTSHPESATREVVWEMVMGKKVDYARNARIVYATKKEMVMTAEDPGAIGAVSIGFLQAYENETRRVGLPVEVKAVRTERISRPLAIVTNGPPAPEVEKLLAFLRTDQARQKFR